jgi:hypothetical protein
MKKPEVKNPVTRFFNEPSSFTAEASPDAASLKNTRLSVSQDILFRYNLPMRNLG